MKYESPLKNRAYRALALEIGGKIAAEGRRKKMTITQIAERAGVSQGNLCRMNNDGSCCLQLLALYKVASALSVPISRILPPGGWA